VNAPQRPFTRRIYKRTGLNINTIKLPPLGNISSPVSYCATSQNIPHLVLRNHEQD
jgi:hypothetical protein